MAIQAGWPRTSEARPMPAHTIVVPCHNQAALLADCLRSVVAQTVHDWEVVVVDDGSTEGDIAGTVDSIADPRIRLHRFDQNRGLAAARNAGIRLGSGPIILPLDSDDLLDPRFLERLSPALLASEVDCVFGDLALFGDVDGTLEYQVRDIPTLLTRQWLPGPGCLYRRTFWERAGGYCEHDRLRPGNEDWDFYLSAAEVGFVARHVPEALYRYRVSGASMGMRLRYVNHETRDFIYLRHRALFDRYRKGGRFRSAGYRVSARESLARGERGRALRLALKAWILDPRVTIPLGLAVRALLPTRVLDAARRFRRGRAAGRADRD